MTELTLETLRGELAPLRSDVEMIKVQISGLPLPGTWIAELRDAVRQQQQDLRMLRAAVNDMARINITGGEVEAIHTDLQRIEAEQIEIKARLARLEQQS